MKNTFKEQLQFEMEILVRLLEESNDEAQQQAIIEMLAELTRYINKD